MAAPLRSLFNGTQSHHAIPTLKTKATVTNRKSLHWASTETQAKASNHSSANGTPFRDQSNSKLYILALRHHFQTKRHEVVHLSIESCILALAHASKAKQRQQIVHLSTTSTKQHHFTIKATATYRHCGTTAKLKQRQQIVHLSTGAPNSGPKQWQQFVHFSMGAPLRSQRSGSKL